MSIMVGVGRGAQAGVLIKNAEAIELMEKVRHAGRRQDRHADRRQTAPNDSDCQRCDLRAGIARARRRGRSAERTSARCRDRTAARGARHQARRSRQISNRPPAAESAARSTAAASSIGKAAFLRDAGVSGLEQLETQARGACKQQGNGVVFVAIDGRAAGILAVSDPIKESTAGRDRASASARYRRSSC